MLMTRILVLLGVFMGGFAYGSLASYVDNIGDCVSYKGWTGYRAINEHNERRCFWIEDSFPKRVKHGKERI